MVKPKLLGLSPEPMGGGPHVLDTNMAFSVHFTEKFAERDEDSPMYWAFSDFVFVSSTTSISK